MSIAGAADRTNDDVRNASAQARFDHAAHHALNDNLETLFRWRDILRQRAITFEVDDIAACRATSRGILQVELDGADQSAIGATSRCPFSIVLNCAASGPYSRL